MSGEEQKTTLHYKGFWIDNGDGTYTATAGCTLWDLYGSDWKEYSDYEGNPKSLKPGDIVGKKRNLDDLPLAPTWVDVDENIKRAKSMSMFDFYTAVKNKGKWDYKQYGSAYEDFGNFNYGATGSTLFPKFVLRRGAGYAQNRAGTSKESWGKWYQGKPYGDDPKDQDAINKGINYYYQNLNELFPNDYMNTYYLHH